MLRQSARSLLRQPGLLLGLILSVALGIGSNAAIFAFASGLISVPSPLADAGAGLTTVIAQSGRSQGLLNGHEVAWLREQSVFDAVAAIRETVGTLRTDRRAMTGAVAMVSSEGASLLSLGTGDGVALGPAAQQTFGAPERITIDEVAYEGPVSTPAWLEGLFAGRPLAAWIVVDAGALAADDPDARTLTVVAQLPQGVSLDEAQRQLDAREPAVRLLLDDYSGLTPEASAAMQRLRVLLTVVAGAILALTCLNVAVLLLSRAARRSHEISIRIALGVTRRTLAIGLLVDAVLIVVPGLAAGLLLAVWTANVLPALLFAQDAEQLTFAPDLGVTAAAVLACAALVAGCGMVPLIENRHDRPADVLRRRSVHGEGPIARLQRSLVVAQMAGCCAFVVAAAFLTDSFQAALRTQAGRGAGTRVLAEVEASRGFAREDLGLQYFRGLADAVSQVPGVFSTAWISRAPGTHPSWRPFAIERPHASTREVQAPLLPFTRETIDEVTLPPLTGRMFGGGDSPGGCPVVVLNQSAASAWFDDAAVGRWLRSHAGERFEIVGVLATPARPAPLVYFYPEQLGSAGVADMRFDVPSGGFRRGILNTNAVSGNYFQVMGGTLDGTDGHEADRSESPCRTGIVNQEAADLYFDGEAVGGAVIDASGQRTTIVGVVQEFAIGAWQRDIPPTVYFRHADEYSPHATLVFAAAGEVPDILEEAGRQLTAVSGGALRRLETLDDHLARTALATERIAALLVRAATAVALVLGILGLNRAVADDLWRRRQEFATRSALGSPAWRLVPVLLRQGARWAAAGALLGLLCAWVAGIWLRGLTGFDAPYAAWAWLAGPAVLAAGVVIASAVPAVRAIRVDPLMAMKT